MADVATEPSFDVIVIGGGFFGCSLALHLRQRFKKVLVIEKEAQLLQRASYANQARVHGGYHYPRSLLTAARSRINLPRFATDFRDCVVDTFDKIYAIARRNSKVTARQFVQVFTRLGAPVQPAPDKLRKLFDPSEVEDVFLVQEYAFDAVALGRSLEQRMERAGVEVWRSTTVDRVAHSGSVGQEALNVELADGRRLRAGAVYNCTYSQINSLLRRSELPLLGLKHELAEIALVEVPDELRNVGITVMDGPFFSTMPFPAQNLHSLSHVRYTPHIDWQDRLQGPDVGEQIRAQWTRSNFPFMIRDAGRFIPLLRQARHIRSLFEIKTVLLQNEVDDGRPILFRRDYGLPGLCVVLGGKIDNVYDMLAAIDAAVVRAAPAASVGSAAQLLVQAGGL